MIQIARTWRVFAGGIAAGFVGVMVIAGGRASADPLLPVPPPPLPGVNSNRFVAAQPTPYPVASPGPAAAPGAPGPAAGAPMPPSVTPAISGTLRDYLQAKGVKLVAQKPQGFKALDITLPVPTRWTQVPDPNVPDAFAVIADRLGNSVYTSNAQVVVYKLVGDFDPREAITHGFVDSQKLLAWQTTNASLADLGGFPSSIIEGTYRENDMTLNASRRHVIATSGTDKYLVSLAVTTALSQAVADGPATDAIINGFRVAAPGQAAPAPTQTPATATPAPGSAPLGLPGQAPGQMPAPSPAPNQLALIPGLPPLPNLMAAPPR